MSRAAADLPDDPAELRRLASGLQHDVVVLEAAMAAQALLVEKLKHQLALLRRARFGRSSEKLDAQIEQFELLIGDLEETAAEVQATQPPRTTAATPAERKPSVRAPLPHHLPIDGLVDRRQKAAGVLARQPVYCEDLISPKPLEAAEDFSRLEVDGMDAADTSARVEDVNE